MSRSVHPFVTKRLGFDALDGVRAPSPQLLYSVGGWPMIQLNDSESLVSVQQVFSDHRARAPTGHTNLVRSPCMGPNPYSGWRSGGLGVDKNLRKVKKSIFAISFCFDPTSLGESPATSYAASRPPSHPLTHLNPSLRLHTHPLPSARWGHKQNFRKFSENLQKLKNQNCPILIKRVPRGLRPRPTRPPGLYRTPDPPNPSPTLHIRPLSSAKVGTAWT